MTSSGSAPLAAGHPNRNAAMAYRPESGLQSCRSVIQCFDNPAPPLWWDGAHWAVERLPGVQRDHAPAVLLMRL
jgi:hypothetical protein